MAKEIQQYKCSSCDNVFNRPMGKCPRCGEFNSLEKYSDKSISESIYKSGLRSSSAIMPARKAMTIQELNKKPFLKTKTGILEFDRVIGGGLVEGQIILFAGHPGSGKSTLSLSISEKFAKMGKRVLYSSGEESEQQIGLRAKRMEISNDLIKIVNETNLETLLGHIEEEKPDLLIVDSLQTLSSAEVAGTMGSISQGKEAANTLQRIAKKKGLTMILINQILKSGDFSGSESVQHIVDTTLILDSDSDSPLKFLRATKNRFGDTTEVGIFQHSENGLEEVSDPAGVFLDSDDSESVSGASRSFISEGVRQIPVEIQSLATDSTLPNPRKQFNGINFARGQIVCAILDKFCKTRLGESDVFISTVSGLKVLDPQCDLAIAAAILSSVKDKTVNPKYVFIGELSLTGQVRGSFMIDNKLREAERLGFTKAIVPSSARKNSRFKSTKLSVEYVGSVKDFQKFV